MTLIYDFSNDGTTMVKKGNTVEGLCFGYSSVWCVKMQKHAGKNQLLTKPAQFEAFPLQQRVEQIEDNSDWSTAVPKMIKTWGHDCTSGVSVNYAQVATKIAADKGHYIIDIGDHWVAAACTDSIFAYFDSNEGMHTYKDQAAFVQGIGQDFTWYKGQGGGWEDNHNIYKVTD